MFLVSSCSSLCPIHWSQVLSQEWCSWSSAGRLCSNYIWVINKFIAYWDVPYIRDLTIINFVVIIIPADAIALLGAMTSTPTVYPKKYAHGFVVLCFVVVMQSFIMNSHEVFIHIHQGCFAGTGAIVRLPQCQWSKPDGYGKISQCITTTKHSKAKTVCIFLGIYCTMMTKFGSCKCTGLAFRKL